VGRDEVILLDTHCLVWMADDDPSLGRRCHAMVQAARQQGQLAVSAISFWEIALLAAKSRLKLVAAPAALRRDLFDTGVIEGRSPAISPFSRQASTCTASPPTASLSPPQSPTTPR
jgi:hypothetical protein